jgi:hypothetical protein
MAKPTCRPPVQVSTVAQNWLCLPAEQTLHASSLASSAPRFVPGLHRAHSPSVAEGLKRPVSQSTHCLSCASRSRPALQTHKVPSTQPSLRDASVHVFGKSPAPHSGVGETVNSAVAFVFRPRAMVASQLSSAQLSASHCQISCAHRVRGLWA